VFFRPSGGEDPFLENVLELLPGDLFDDHSEQHGVGVRVVEALPGCE
jgi:hypothetical protein